MLTKAVYNQQKKKNPIHEVEIGFHRWNLIRFKQLRSLRPDGVVITSVFKLFSNLVKCQVGSRERTTVRLGFV